MFGEKNKTAQNPFYELISGGDRLLRSARFLGIKSIFLDKALLPVIPELQDPSGLKFYPDSEILWTSVYSLSITNQRVMALINDQSLLNFSYLEKYLSSGSLRGGVVTFIIKKSGEKILPGEIKNIFPVYNFHRQDDFIHILPQFFDLSERLKLPVLILANNSIFNEFTAEDDLKTAQRTEIKPDLNVMEGMNNNKPSLPVDMRRDLSLFKNTGSLVEFFSGETHENLILTDSDNFQWLIENPHISKSSDIILFNLLNPFFTDEFNRILENNCRGYYKNLFIFDDYSFLDSNLSEIKNSLDSQLKYDNFSTLGGKNNKRLCFEYFEPGEISVSPSFCPGCNLYAFLQGHKNDESVKNDIFIGDDICFSLLKSSALKYNFPNVFTVENPLYFVLNLEPANSGKRLFMVIPSSKLSGQIDIVLEKLNGSSNVSFIIYKSIFDYEGNFHKATFNPSLKSLKNTIIRGRARLKDIKKKGARLIFIDNDCSAFAKRGRDLDYTKYLEIKSTVCDKYECKLCVQETKCPGIVADSDGKLVIEPAICNICYLCVDICPHRAIKLRKRKEIKKRKSLENRIDIKYGKY